MAIPPYPLEGEYIPSLNLRNLTAQEKADLLINHRLLFLFGRCLLAGEEEPAWLRPLIASYANDDNEGIVVAAGDALAAYNGTVPAWHQDLMHALPRSSHVGVMAAIRQAVIEYNAGVTEEEEDDDEEDEGAEEEEANPVAKSHGEVTVDGYRWVCYKNGCNENTKRRDELARHWSTNRGRSNSNMHPPRSSDPDPKKRFLVRGDIIKSDEGLALAAQAESAEEFIELWEARGDGEE